MEGTESDGARPDPASKHEAEPRLTPRRVLLIDGEKTVRNNLGTLIRQDGHEVILASGVREALEAVGSEVFDAGIVGVGRKEGNGMMVVTRLLLPPYPCASLVLSGLPRDEIAPQAVAAGAYELVYKPYAAAVLRPRLALTFARTLKLRSWYREMSLALLPELDRAARTAEPPHHVRKAPFPENGLVYPLALMKARLAGLTGRQTVVYLYLARGYSYEEIAERMRIKLSTLEKHAAQVRRKLHVATNEELTGQLLSEVDDLLAGRFRKA